MAVKTGSVDPSKFPGAAFDLYSIPAFDRGAPEVTTGSEIGSSKQLVEPGDVLLSKIVPHIRRSWIVGKDDSRRMIASGEWIVFRSHRADPNDLRHVVIGDLPAQSRRVSGGAHRGWCIDLAGRTRSRARRHARSDCRAGQVGVGLMTMTWGLAGMDELEGMLS